MGTTWSARLVLPNSLTKEAAQAAIQSALNRVVAQMSTWEATSDICRYNHPAAHWHVLPAEFFFVLRHALDLARQTGGAYDPTVGPLTRAWGFGPEGGNREPPRGNVLQAARAQCGWNRVELDTAGCRAWQPGTVELDLSSIAKGYGVDAAAQALDSLGLTDYLVEVGGELRTRGRRPDGHDWHVAIESPQGQGHAMTLPLRDCAMATSGDYQRYFEGAGKRYAHTVDPRSGLTVDNGVASVTVVHRSCMQADALATALMVLGLEAGMAWAQKQGVAALFIVRAPHAFQLYATPAFEQRRHASPA
jgi:thiamine biosynthesis lipoprotein